MFTPSPGRADERPVAPTSINPFRALLKHRNFRLFWIGQTISLIGTWMQMVAQGWLALELSDSAFIVGLVSAAGSLPILALSLPGGVIADRYDKLRLVKIGQALLALEALALWALIATDLITIPWLLALATINGVISAFEIPARQSLLIDLVVREDLMDAIALNTSGFNLARIIGPSIAAAVIAGFGLVWCFALNSVSYAAVLIGLGLVRLPAWRPPQKRVSPVAGMREGLRYLVRTPEVAVIMRMVGIFSVFGLPFLTLMPVFARDALGLGATGYGLLMTITGVGALAGALFLAAVGGRVRKGRLFAISSFAFPVVVAVLAFTSLPVVAGGILLFAGLAMILNTALGNGLLQSIVPDALRGRVMAAYVVVYIGFSPFGSFLGGAVARLFGVEWTLAGGAAVMLAFAAWTLWKHPEIARL